MVFDRLRALNGYLGALQANSNFASILDQQCGEVAREIRDLDSLELDNATTMLALVAQCVHWQQSHRDTLQEAIQEKCQETVRGKVIRPRNPMQDYTNFPLHLTSQDWRVVGNRNSNVVSRCNCIMNRLWNLGLRCPSEPTMAMVTTCLLLVEPERFSDGLQMRSSYQGVKDMVKKYLKNLGSENAVGPRVLPATLNALPQNLMDDAYGSPEQMNSHGLPNLPNGVSIDGLNQLCSMVPIRSTNRQVNLQLQLPKAAGFAHMGHAMGNRQPLALMNAPHSETGVVVSPVVTQPEVAMPKQLAMAAPFEPAEPQQGQVAPPALEPDQNGQVDVAMATVEDQLQVVAPTDSAPVALPSIEDKPAESNFNNDAPQVPNALESNTLLEDALSARETKKKGGTNPSKPVMKKPSASTMKAGNTKAGPLETKKLKAAPVLKRPAGAVKSGHCKGPIPSQKVRMRLRPNGCAKCRERAGCCDSCWVQRGFRKG
eukprot:Skav220936  [mRNA]  locus=scaffold3184:321763:323513:- [translate_table: standard]